MLWSKAFFKTLFTASSLLQRNRWCNVSEYICQISLFSQSHVSQKWCICRHVFTMTQLSTFSGASEALFGVKTLPATEKTRSLLLLATGIARTTLTRKARRGSASWWFFHQFSWSMSEGASGITFSYVEHSFWNLLVGVVVTMIMIKIGENYVIWPAHEAETKIPKNPGEISEQSRD